MIVDTFVVNMARVIGLPYGGWGNGYVVIDKSHPLFKKDYDELNGKYSLDVELTFSNYAGESWQLAPEKYRGNKDYWIFGFDTMHYGMTDANWPKERVEAETKKLAEFFFMKWVEHHKTKQDKYGTETI